MKIIDIITLYNSNLSEIKYDELPADVMYKTLKLKIAINKAIEDIKIIEKDILQMSDINEDVQTFESNLKKLKENKHRNIEDDEKYNTMLKSMDLYIELRNLMFNDEISLQNVDLISYEEWRMLRKMNRNVFNNHIEDALKNIFWKEPIN